MPAATTAADIPTVSNSDPQPAARARFARLCALHSRELILSGRVFEDPSPGTRVLLGGGDPGCVTSWRPLPATVAVRVFVAGRELTLEDCEVLGFWQRLLLAEGLYEAELTLRDPAGRTTRLQTMRFIPLQAPRSVRVRYVVAPLDHRAGIEILAGIAGRPWRDGPPGARLRFDAPRPQCVTAALEGGPHLHARTHLHRRTRVAGVSSRIEHDAAWTVVACPGRQRSVIEHAMRITRDTRLAAEGEPPADFYALLERSRRLWRRRWASLEAAARAACAADAAVARAVAGMLAALSPTDCGH